MISTTKESGEDIRREYQVLGLGHIFFSSFLSFSLFILVSSFFALRDMFSRRENAPRYMWVQTEVFYDCQLASQPVPAFTFYVRDDTSTAGKGCGLARRLFYDPLRYQ